MGDYKLRYSTFKQALLQLGKDGHIWPYGFIPGAKLAGENKDVYSTRDKWESYNANPPQFLISEYPDPDPNASSHLSYDDLIAASNKYKREEIKKKKEYNIELLNAECERRIALQYGAIDGKFNTEMKLRLRGITTVEQDIERDRLRGIHDTLRAQIKTSTVSKLGELDVTANTHWEKPK